MIERIHIGYQTGLRALFAEVLGAGPRARILIEAATESEWVARG